MRSCCIFVGCQPLTRVSGQSKISIVVDALACECRTSKFNRFMTVGHSRKSKCFAERITAMIWCKIYGRTKANSEKLFTSSNRHHRNFEVGGVDKSAKNSKNSKNFFSLHNCRNKHNILETSNRSFVRLA
jgi:hypothetical protein